MIQKMLNRAYGSFFCETAGRRLSTMVAGTLMLLTPGPIAMVSLCAAPQEKAESPRAEFEVASIKPNKTIAAMMRFQPLPGGRLVAENVPVRFLIMTAFDLPPSQISGGPGFGAEADRYDIQAKAPEGSDSRLLTREMLQALLETRFRMKYHWVIEQRRVYDLTVDKGGPKIKHSVERSCVRIEDAAIGASAKPGDPVICGFHGMQQDGLNRTTEMMGVTMSEFAMVFATTELRNVIDHTGLSGTFDIKLRYVSCPALGQLAPTDPGTPAEALDCGGDPSILRAVKEQLGLKLAPAQGPVRVMVIDSIEKPTEN